MSLPILAGSYEQYKRDTELVKDWLVSTARSLQCPDGLLPTPTPTTQPEPGGMRKGKARKRTKIQVASATPTGSRKSEPPAKFPAKGYITLAKYIAAKATSIPHNVRTRIDHAIALRTTFGINRNDYVLKDVREALKPLQSIDTNHDFSNTPNIETSAAAQDAHTIPNTEEQIYFEEAFGALTAVINDSNKMRDRVRWIWSNYKTGIFDIATAAIATDAAVGLVGSLMEDVLPLLKQHGGIRNMVGNVYLHQCLAQGWDETELVVVGDAFNYATYDVADRTYFSTFRLLEGFTSLATDVIPLAREGDPVRYDATSDRSCKTGREKYEDDRALLMRFVPELMTASCGVCDWPVRDKFLRGIEELHRTREVPFYAVFAAQIFLDITYELGLDITRPFNTLIEHTSFMEIDIDLHFKHRARLRIETWPSCNDDQMRELQRNIQWIGTDPLRAVQTQWYRQAQTAVPDMETHRIFRLSPVISGLMLYHFRFRYRQAGFAVADTWGSITSCMHLYNALGNEKLVQHTWVDMNILCACLSESSFFSRWQFYSQIGISGTAMSNRRLKKTPPTSRAEPRQLVWGSPISSMFKTQYVGNGNDASLTRNQVHQIIERSLFKKEGSEEDGTLMMFRIIDPKKLERIHRLNDRQQPGATQGVYIHPEQLIKDLAFVLGAETFEFSFPYLCMHRSCWQLLRAVQQSCDTLLRQLHSPAYLTHESQLPFIIGYILTASSTRASTSGCRLLEKAAEAFNDFIGGDAGDFIVTQVLERQLRMPVRYGTNDSKCEVSTPISSGVKPARPRSWHFEAG
ncbi:hypothetical protein F5Y16DRAFT_419947 [Xylariaceae sp. FL0255]|nr:hypothetical protein F5Y16DRAFT_419947 [Xylariaceae sp. FL0255]